MLEPQDEFSRGNSGVGESGSEEGCLCPGHLRFVCFYDTHVARLRANRLVSELAGKLGTELQVRRLFWKLYALSNADTRLIAETATASADVVVVAHSRSDPTAACDILSRALPASAAASDFALVSPRVRSGNTWQPATFESHLQSIAIDRGIRFFSTEVPRLAFESSPARRR
jgi:hypothetical protein